MNIKSQRLRYLAIILVLFLLNFYSGILGSISTATVHNTTTEITPLEKFDLGLTGVITEVESSFKRNMVLSKTWDHLVLNMTIQNFGDPLDNVFLKVNVNGVPTQATFSTLEQKNLAKAFYYQFEVPQTLVMILNHTKQTEVELEILVILDHAVALRNLYVNLSINCAELIGLNLVEPYERGNLPIFPVNHLYQIQPAKFSFLKKNLLASIILFVQIPSEMRLDCTISATLEGVGIDYLKVDDQTFYPNRSTRSIDFNYSISEISNDQGLPLTILVAPDYEGLSGLTNISLSLAVSGELESIPESSVNDVLGSHPIPGWLMIPVLIVGLFGVPYYLVYQEHITSRDNNILDPKKHTKL